MNGRYATRVLAGFMVAALIGNAHGAILQVDDDNVQCFGATHHTINSALAIANPGDQIEVCPGLYPEQVVLTNRISLRGRRIGSLVPVIKPIALPATRPSIFGGNPIAAAVIIDTEASGISDFEIDLTDNALPGCTPALVGVYWRNASGAQTRVDVLNARLALRPDCESGVATLIESGKVGDIFGQPVVGRSVVSLTGNRFSGFQKSGLVALGDRTLARIQESQAIGGGPSTGAVQNGFEVGKAARARLQDIAAENLRTLVPDKTATAILVFSSDKVRIRRVTATDVQTGAFLVGDRNRVLSGQFGAIRSDAVVVLGERNKVAANDIDGSSVSGVFIDGDANRVLGGLIRNTPIGVWSFDGTGNTSKGIEFINVPERIRVGGTRQLTSDDASPFDPACSTDGECDDGNACTVDTCTVLTGACVHVAEVDATPCSDGNLCNGAETCLAGVCTAGAPLVCTDGLPCTLDSCLPTTGCDFPPAPDTTPCADGDLCNGAETCLAGACTAGAPLVCTDGLPCTVDSCVPATGCDFPPAPDTTPCADGDLCNGAETCLAGACTAGAPLVCTDGLPCTIDSCVAATGCDFPPAPDTTPCADGDLCNGDETCQAGACTAGAPLVCTDALECTIDACIPATGCDFTPDVGASCNLGAGICDSLGNCL